MELSSGTPQEAGILPEELVGVYLSVPLRERGFMEVDWNGDLFENAVTAAVAD